jgi:hypothetical protein
VAKKNGDPKWLLMMEKLAIKNSTIKNVVTKNVMIESWQPKNVVIESCGDKKHGN